MQLFARCFLLVPSLKQSLMKKRQRNLQFSNKVPFAPLNRHAVYGVHRRTCTHLLHDLIHLAQNTQFFTVDTESDLVTNRLALIQIEMIHASLSTVVLVELAHLPDDSTSLQCWLIQSLLKSIFTPSKEIYAWGDLQQELTGVIPTGRLNVVNVQKEFKSWYGTRFLSDPTGNQKWGLQSAIATTFDEFLDKSETLNTWSCALLYARHSSVPSPRIQSMIDYAVNDCLAVTKLACRIGQAVVREKDISSSSSPFDCF
jgi:hypothetical protein